MASIQEVASRAALDVVSELQNRHPHSIVVPGFVDTQLSIFSILGIFFAASIVIVSATWSFTRRYAHLSVIDRILMCWWALTGMIHIVLEGYFVFTPEFYKRKDVHYLAEVWKEYNKGDCRYAARDPTIVTVEAITAVFVGPGSLLAVYGIAARKPFEHALQLAVSLAQLYGDTVYYGTVFVDGREFAAPGFLYYWFYFMFLNSIWILVPIAVAIRSWQRICNASTLNKKLA